MKRVVLLIAVALIVITGCQRQKTAFMDGSEKETITTSNTIAVASKADTTTEQDLVKSLDDLYKSYHSLKIQKGSESLDYDAAKPLEYIFADMVSKVEEMDMNTPEGELKEFNYDDCDYRLKFEGAKDILFTIEGNVFHFEGEKQLYALWGNSSPLWGRLVFDTKNNSVDIDGEKIRVMNNVYKEDADGDGKAENIELVYERGKSEDFKGDLIVSINGSEATMMKGDEWFTKPYRSIGELPEIKFLQERNGKGKAVLVIYSWATNGVGSTGGINVYKYVDRHISEVKVNDVERIIKYKGKNTVNVDFPALKRTTNMKIDIDQFTRFLGEGNLLKQQLEAKDTFYSHPLWYLVKDYNGDGREELCSVSILRMPPLALCRQYTYYEYENGELRPVQAIATSLHTDDERESYLKDSILDLIQFQGYLTIGDKGIVDEAFKPGYDYTPSEIAGTLEELQKDKILKLKGDRLYIDY